MDFNFVLTWRRAGMPSTPDVSSSVSRLGIVGLGQVPHSPLQTKWPYLGDPLGRSIALPPSLFGWMAPCISQLGKPAD